VTAASVGVHSGGSIRSHSVRYPRSGLVPALSRDEFPILRRNRGETNGKANPEDQGDTGDQSVVVVRGDRDRCKGQWDDLADLGQADEESRSRRGYALPDRADDGHDHYEGEGHEDQVRPVCEADGDCAGPAAPW
jgi:hypothetical protein